MIRKHPVLKDAETTVTVFTVIDDTKEDYNGTTTVSTTDTTNEPSMEILPVTETVNTGSASNSSLQSSSYGSSIQRDEQVTADDLSAFANL
jgi:hypothetical protein